MVVQEVNVLPMIKDKERADVICEQVIVEMEI